MYRTLGGVSFTVASVVLFSGAASAASLPLTPPGPVLSAVTTIDFSNSFTAMVGQGVGPLNMFYFQLSPGGTASMTLSSPIDPGVLGPVPMEKPPAVGGLITLSLCDADCQAAAGGKQPTAITLASVQLTATGSPQTLDLSTAKGVDKLFFSTGAFLPAETVGTTGNVYELCIEGIPTMTTTVTYGGTVKIVPEASTWVMMAFGFAGLASLGVLARRRKAAGALA
jgi:hypothetical protein